MINIILIACQFVQPQYVGCKGDLAWCGENGCVLTNLKCDISKTGNIYLPESCFKRL